MVDAIADDPVAEAMSQLALDRIPTDVATVNPALTKPATNSERPTSTPGSRSRVP
jgi:hypothetical protein